VYLAYAKCLNEIMRDYRVCVRQCYSKGFLMCDVGLHVLEELYIFWDFSISVVSSFRI
jgi:hypothetical protein